MTWLRDVLFLSSSAGVSSPSARTSCRRESRHHSRPTTLPLTATAISAPPSTGWMPRSASVGRKWINAGRPRPGLTRRPPARPRPDGHRPVARGDPPVRVPAADRAAALVDRPHPAGPPLRRLLRRAARPRLRRHRGRAVHLLPPPPVRLLAGRPGCREPALRRHRPRPDRRQGLWTDKPATNFVSVTSQQDKKNQPDPVRLAGRVTRGLPRPAARLRPVPQPPVRRVEAGRLPGPLRVLRPDAHRLHRRLRRRRASTRSRTRRTKEKRIVPPRVPFAPELLPGRRHAAASGSPRG